jgi:hypothetical protein
MRVCEISKRDYKLRHDRPSAWNNSAPTGRIFIKFDVWVLFRKYVEKIEFSLKMTGMTGTLHDRYTFFIMSHSILVIMINVSDLLRKSKQPFHVERRFSKIVPFMRH